MEEKNITTRARELAGAAILATRVAPGRVVLSLTTGDDDQGIVIAHSDDREPFVARLAVLLERAMRGGAGHRDTEPPPAPSEPPGFAGPGPLPKNTMVPGCLLTLAGKVLELAEVLERDDLLKIGVELRKLSQQAADERSEAWEKGKRYGADEERERVERLLRAEAEGAQADIEATEAMVAQARARRGALRVALGLVQVHAGQGSTPG